jgi:Domain of unknown function (DUF4424)
MMRFVSALAAVLLADVPALGNDGYSEIGIGGLVLTDTEAVSMDKEDLFISAHQIRVEYVMTNQTDKDVEALVMFPLPDIVLKDEADSARGIVDFAKDLKFETKVDGKPFAIVLEQRAVVGEVDVTDAVLKAGLPVNGIAEDFSKLVFGLPQDVRQNLMKLGVLERLLDDAGNEIPYPPDLSLSPQWNVRSYVARKQVFAAGKSVSVSHSYVPVAGASVGGNLSPEYRNEDFVKEKVATFCIEDSWFAAFDKQIKKRATAENPSPYGETWVKYILKSGSTWKGPIKDFRLVVDKGETDSLVSFCGDGVKKISPTQFEVRKNEFEPKDDLHVLVVDWVRE